MRAVVEIYLNSLQECIIMSKAGKRLIESAQQALDFAEGKAEADSYRVHFPETTAKSDRQESKRENEESAKKTPKRGSPVPK